MPIQPKQQPPYYNQATNVKTYVALLTQTGTNAPTATILQNNIGNIIWTRDTNGLYTATATGLLPTNKTIAKVSNNGQVDTQFYAGSNEDDNSIYLNTSDGTAPADDLMTNTPIEIITYNI